MHYLIIAVLAFGLSLMGCEGKTGPAGPTGPGGAAGPAGPAGPQGSTGPAGPAGPQGPAGADGADGADGPAGPAGPAGETGPAGPQGEKGDQGDPGAGVDPGTIGGIVNEVIGTGVLSDIHHIVITRGSNDKKYYYLAPNFDQGGDKEDGTGNNMSPLNLIAGTDDMLTAKAASQSGDVVDAMFSWSSNSDEVVSIDGDGMIEAGLSGEAKLSLTVDGRGIKIDINVNVAGAIDHVLVAGPGTQKTTKDGGYSLIIPEGSSVKLDATAHEKDASEIAGAAFEWASSNPAVASVDGGTVSANGAGTTSITATAGGKTSKPVKVTVTPIGDFQYRLRAVRKSDHTLNIARKNSDKDHDDYNVPALTAADFTPPDPTATGIEGNTAITYTIRVEERNDAGNWVVATTAPGLTLVISLESNDTDVISFDRHNDLADPGASPAVLVTNAVTDMVSASAGRATYTFDQRHVNTAYGQTSITASADGAEGTSFVIGVAAP